MSDEIGVLARRRIQAEVIKPIYEVMKREIGDERAQAIIGEAVSSDAIREGKLYASREPEGADIESFVRLQHLWEKDGALEVEVLAADERRFDYNVKRCRYAEMYREMGIGEIGHLLSCNRDADFIVGYDDRVELKRSSTIMRGGSCCDFRYRLKDEGVSTVQEGADGGD
ncbi:MAG: L-2-amino-thiazoline-4-carboxylic acid hydrolase [Hyphomonadaceae bacterium]|nr:L-2-amino-thiazoline-4-carboxylic acid hydrolase [Hyphomonadaceae bacterium]